MEELKGLCKNPWCKATFVYKEEQMFEGKAPSQCFKCFNDSGSVTWTDKKYDDELYDGTPQQLISYKIKTWY